jgi:hypothetical protein
MLRKRYAYKISYLTIFIQSYEAASTSTAPAEFSGVLSPLEPLDPNKFRNIMLDKQDVSIPKTPQRLSMESMDSSTPSNEFRGFFLILL